MGGHSVPEDVVRRRYDKGLSNFNSIYSSLSDFWVIYDNSAEVPKMVAFKKTRIRMTNIAWNKRARTGVCVTGEMRLNQLIIL